MIQHIEIRQIVHTPSMKTLIISFAILLLFSYPAHGYDKLAGVLYPEYKTTVEQFSNFSLKEAQSVINFIDLPSSNTGHIKNYLDHIRERLQDDDADIATIFSKYDFSGDGNDDLVISSYFGSEEIKTLFWTKTGTIFYFAGAVEGRPKFYKSKTASPAELLTRSGWCCFGHVGAINLYTLKNIDGRLQYVLVRKIMEMGNVQIPDKIQVAGRFITINDKYRLRSWPEVRDEHDPEMSSFHGKPTYGNIIAEFEKGSKGEAIATQTDKTGRVWWFVIMDNDAKTRYNLFYGDEAGCKTGWMSSRYLDVIK